MTHTIRAPTTGATHHFPSLTAAMQQKQPRKRNRGSSWMRLRAIVLRKEPLCRLCSRRGIVTSASEVDHIQPLHLDGTDRLDNLQPLCHSCHARKTAVEQGSARAGAGLDGIPFNADDSWHTPLPPNVVHALDAFARDHDVPTPRSHRKGYGPSRSMG